jgi:hypothetical protein
MRTRSLLLTASLFTFTTSLAGQVLAVGTTPVRAAGTEWARAAVRAYSDSAALSIVEHAIGAALLRPSYRMRLISDWPQLTAGGLGCVNGGQEVLEGTLAQTGDRSYAGRFRRRATIRFCGAHAGATELCTLTLTSDGIVAARGTVAIVPGEWSDPAIELRWTTPDGASDATVEGNCTAEFNEKVKQLYLSASHALEFTLPPAGEPRRTMSLDDYGWIVDVR